MTLGRTETVWYCCVKTAQRVRVLSAVKTYSACLLTVSFPSIHATKSQNGMGVATSFTELPASYKPFPFTLPNWGCLVSALIAILPRSNTAVIVMSETILK